MMSVVCRNDLGNINKSHIDSKSKNSKSMYPDCLYKRRNYSTFRARGIRKKPRIVHIFPVTCVVFWRIQNPRAGFEFDEIAAAVKRNKVC